MKFFNTRSKPRHTTVVASAVALACLSMQTANADDQTLSSAFTSGMPYADIRLRTEFVEQDGVVEDAAALTLRTRLGYQTGEFYGFQLAADIEDIRPLGDEDFNSTSNGQSTYPVVADPEETELNQAYLSYRTANNAKFKLGRQRIVLDNARFIGNVGWRQNEQTYDAFTANFELRKNTKVFYGHINNVNRIFGEHHPNPAAADTDVFADLINVSHSFENLTVRGYAYLVENEDNPLASAQTVGVHLNGSFKPGVKLTYLVEVAQQTDYKDGSPAIDADYGHVNVGVGFEKVSLAVGYELLGGDGVYAFSTPLATLHAFNGWADKFLGTPATGLKDTYFSAKGAINGFKIMGVFHDFAADTGGADYGTEVDLVVSKKIGELSTLTLKYAAYSADTFATDTDKIWLQWQLKF